MTHKITWLVSLSNGETFSEGVGQFEEIEGALSPWQKLLVYLAENSLQITSLVLVNNNRTFNLPSAGKNPKFRPFSLSQKPIKYELRRYVSRESNSAEELPSALIGEWFTVGVAIYPDYELQIWVDENNPNNCWGLCAKLN